MSDPTITDAVKEAFAAANAWMYENTPYENKGIHDERDAGVALRALGLDPSMSVGELREALTTHARAKSCEVVKGPHDLDDYHVETGDSEFDYACDLLAWLLAPVDDKETP